MAGMRNRVVFVGGMVRGLLTTDPGAGAPRVTDDVDLIVDVPSLQEYYRLAEQLRDQGFREPIGDDDASTGRWSIEGVKADIMPVDPEILGASNAWYPGALMDPAIIHSPEGKLRILSSPYFCATKLEALASRGGGDWYHHDLEDVLGLVNDRVELAEELAAAPEDVRDFVAEQIASLLDRPPFREALPGHLDGDPASQSRIGLLLSRLEAIASLRTAPTVRAVPATPAILTPAIGTSAGTGPFGAQGATGPFGAQGGTGPFGTLGGTGRFGGLGGAGRPTSAVAGPTTGVRQRAKRDRVFLHSTSLTWVEYDESTRVLAVQVRQSGKEYSYAPVPLAIYEGLLRAPSAGVYFNQWIRDRYSTRR